MRIFKVLLTTLVLVAVITVLPGCTAASDTKTATTQESSVIRGNLVKEISAAGNLALSHTEDLAVDLFYPTGTKGTIGEVLVNEGDSVKKDDVLVTLDKNEWNDQLATLKDLVTARDRSLIQAQINLRTAQQAVVTANETIANRQTAVLTAEISLSQAQNTLASAITTVDFPPLAAALNKAKTWYDYVSITLLAQGTMKQSDWELAMQQAEEQLDIAQAAYDNALAGYTSADVTLKKKQVAIAENNLTAAKAAIIVAQNDVPLKQLNLTLSQGNLEDAQKAVEDAKNNLAEAQAKSPEITAPFDGIITKINVEGGDEVLNGTIVVQIADPDKFEADILVSEMDIPQVKVGGLATVIADALPTTFLTATVTHIAPTATISSGVVNYNVKVEVQTAGGNFFSQFGQSGNNTKQAFKSGTFTPPSGTISSGSSGLPGISSNQSMGKFPAMNNTDVELRQGLTVTVSIIVASRTDVLMVPNGAITAEGLNSYVQVIGADGKLEKRQVTTGISNWQFIEITDGVKEGEKIQVSLNTAPDTNFRGGGFFMGGR
jgi:multidrug efflux pump subunit AcrA (membrane-fusion protein)